MSQSKSRRVAHCMYVEIELKKKKILILKVWFYEHSVKLRQSPTHAKEYLGNGVRTHVNSKGKIPSTAKILLRGSNPRRCTKQDSEPNILPPQLFWPPSCPVNIQGKEPHLNDFAKKRLMLTCIQTFTHQFLSNLI